VCGIHASNTRQIKNAEKEAVRIAKDAEKKRKRETAALLKVERGLEKEANKARRKSSSSSESGGSPRGEAFAPYRDAHTFPSLITGMNPTLMNPSFVSVPMKAANQPHLKPLVTAQQGQQGLENYVTPVFGPVDTNEWLNLGMGGRNPVRMGAHGGSIATAPEDLQELFNVNTGNVLTSSHSLPMLLSVRGGSSVSFRHVNGGSNEYLEGVKGEVVSQGPNDGHAREGQEGQELRIAQVYNGNIAASGMGGLVGEDAVAEGEYEEMIGELTGLL